MPIFPGFNPLNLIQSAYAAINSLNWRAAIKYGREDPIGAAMVLAGAVLTAAGAPTVGVPLATAGVAKIVGTALMAPPPRTKSLRESPTYGLDRFENPRGPEAHVPVIYGEPRVRPVCIAESATSIAESGAPGVDVQRKQAVKWLGVVAEGEVASITDIRINDRKVFGDQKVGVDLGRGNGSKKEFEFPSRWVYLGEDEAPDVLVYVDGVLKSYASHTEATLFAMPTSSSVTSFAVTRDNKTDRIIGSSLRVYVRGPGVPEYEQLRRTGVYKWSAQKVAPWKVRVRFQRRPPAGYYVTVRYTVLRTDGLAIVQDAKGVTKAVFGSAPANGKRVTATYRTTAFHGLRIAWTPGSLDQAPLEGFSEVTQSRNPREQKLTKDAPVSGSTDGRQVDNLRFTIMAPEGFIQYQNDENGGTGGVRMRVRIRYKPTGTSSWITLRSATGTSFVLHAERTSTVRWEIGVREEWERLAAGGDTEARDRLAEFERGAYDFDVTLLTSKSNDPLVHDTLVFSHWTEVLAEAYSYPGTSLLGIKSLPSEFLTGSSLRVTCLARRAALYDWRTASGSRDIGSSQNVGLAIRDLLTSSEGVAKERFGAGHFFASTDLDETTLTALADFCDEWVHRPGDDRTRAASSTNGERRVRLNLVLDTPQSLMETIGDVAFLGYAFAAAQGAKWRFPIDRDGDSVFTFVDDVDPGSQNMDSFVLRIEEWGKTPTGILGQFWNETIDHERDELYYPVEGGTEDAPVNVRGVELRGCTRETEAARILRHLAEQAAALPYPCSWEAHPGVQHVEAGDIVTCRTRVPYSTGSTATDFKVRVLAAVVGRDEEGRVRVRYAGRVMASTAYAITAVPVPQSGRRADTTSERSTRRVTGLTARVA